MTNGQQVAGNVTTQGGGPAPFFGLALICLALVGAYIWTSGKWDAVWAVITGTAQNGNSGGAASTTTTPPSDNGQTGKGSAGGWGSNSGQTTAFTIPTYINVPTVGNTVIAQSPAAMNIGEITGTPYTPQVAVGNFSQQVSGTGGFSTN